MPCVLPAIVVAAYGIGEIGITGIGAAVANAGHNATGGRIRQLPIIPDTLIRAVSLLADGLAPKARAH